MSGCLLCFFGCYECWLPCLSAAMRHTTWRTIFTERPFSVSKEWVRSWSHAFLIADHKTLTKKFLAVRPEKVTRRKKRKKTRKVIAKLFALNANAKRCFNVKFSTYHFHMKTKILAELQICIGVPLISEYAFSLHVELNFLF